MLRALLAGVALALGGATTADAAVVESTHRVPVSQPDEAGAGVELDVDVVLPARPAPPSGHPLVVVFHGGGSDKDNAFDAAHAVAYAERGYAAIIYSARGHGGSSGQVTVAGPKEIRDAFDVIDWAMGTFPLDREAIALAGYSQGGLHTNLLQAWADDREINPSGYRFVALEPGNTPDLVFEALIDRGAVKLSFGAGLLQTYFVGARANVSPRVDGWAATAVADRPELYGSGAPCATTGHDGEGVTMRADLAWRSVGCRAERITPPVLWMQAFDDMLFPADMAISMWRRMPNRRNRLYLSMGGHAAPAAPKAVEQDKTELQLDYLDHVVRGIPFDMPRVVYWSRDVATVVPAGVTPYPDGAWVRRTSGRWPPPGIEARVQPLGDGDVPLDVPPPDLAGDPVAVAAFAATPLGTTPATPPPAQTVPGAVLVAATEPGGQAIELSGAPSATLAWTPVTPDTQLVLKVLAELPDGTTTLLTRGVAGVRGATPGTLQTVTVTAKDTSALLPLGARLVAWVTAGDPSFYKAYPGSAGGVLAAADSTLALPVRPAALADAQPPAAPACRDRYAPVSRVQSAAVRNGRLVIRGSSRDRSCRTGVRRVDRVFVSVGRVAGGGRCRPVTASGRLGRARSCRRGLYLDASGAVRWRLVLPARRLTPGRYRVTVKAADLRGNLERPGRRNRLTFTHP